MDPGTNAAKRKKRKTRKCLDEIRKRSRRTSQTLHDDKIDDICSSYIPDKTVTNSRLTIRMFPNAIQSKTITRPELLEFQHKHNFNLDELVKGTKLTNAQSSGIGRIPLTLCDTIVYKRDTQENIELDGNETHVDIIDNDESSNLFSSMDELASESPSSIDTIWPCTGSPAQGVQDDYAYSLYEEFMSELPLCLQQNSRLHQHDVMKKNKTLLQNFLIESCYRQYEDNNLKCTKDDMPDRLYYATRKETHDPMNYIRLNHIQGDNQLVGGSVSDGGSPLRPASSLTLPDAPLDVIVQHTPDYTFYPHRLN